jgi:hypothetical protein
MEKSNSRDAAAGLVKLGTILGQSQAFGVTAGRCSAAQAACLHDLRHSAEFHFVTSRWRQFCSDHLGVDGRNADKIIRLWAEFGAPYFELAQLTRVPSDTYRALAPAIHDGALHLDGDVIELRPENSRRLAAAVASFRRAAPPPKPRPSLAPHERLAALDERAAALVDELRRFSIRERCGENWLQFTSVLTRVIAALTHIAHENGLR